MINHSTVAIVRARCSKTKAGFGIRIDQSAANLAARWAFPLNQENGVHNQSETIYFDGQFTIGNGYPGCPECKAASFFRCGCGKVGCWDGESPTVKCPWCDQVGTLQGTIEFLNASEDC